MSRYAVIDFGSNTIRLCIYALPDVPSDSLTKKDITVLLNYKEMAGISSYVKNGKLSEKGIKKASRILREQIERASYFSPDAVRVFATAVLRNAKNSERTAGSPSRCSRMKKRHCSVLQVRALMEVSKRLR